MFGPIAAVENYIFGALNFSGRATRAEYWWVFLFLIIASIVAVIADLAVVMASQTPSLNPMSYFTTMFMLLTFVPSLTLTARRLHDTGRSSFWYLVVLIPLIGPIWLLVMLLRKSEDEDNKWGPMRRPGRRKVVGKDGKVKHDPWQGYAVLFNATREKSPEEIEAERAQISEYYRQKVLGQRAPSEV